MGRRDGGGGGAGGWLWPAIGARSRMMSVAD
jgi:hypothetical protein